jgi:hypothetical protein
MNKGKNLTSQELEDIHLNTNFVIGHKMMNRARRNRIKHESDLVHHKATIPEIRPKAHAKAIDL